MKAVKFFLISIFVLIAITLVMAGALYKSDIAKDIIETGSTTGIDNSATPSTMSKQDVTSEIDNNNNNTINIDEKPSLLMLLGKLIGAFVCIGTFMICGKKILTTYNRGEK